MYYLATKLYHVNAGLANQFIFNFSIIREYDQFLILLELYKLRIQDEFTLNIVLKHCTENPNRLSLLDKVDNQLQDSLKLSYYETEQYLPTLNQQKHYVNQNYEENKLINFKIFNKFKVIFNKQQVNRFYNDINSYYSNYILLESLYQLALNNTNEPNNKIVDINQKRDSLKQEHQKQNQKQEQISTIELPKQEIKSTQDPTRLDDIFSLSINQVLKSFLIHITTNYYIYITEEYCYLEDNVYNIPNIYPTIYIFNSDYFKSLLSSLNNYTFENIKMRMQKILMKLKEESNELKPLEKMLLINMLFLYCLRILYDTHTDYLNNNIIKLFNDTDLQSRLISNHTKTYFSNIDLLFKIKNISIDDMKEHELDQEIINIGEKYKHLVSVSEEDFINKVLIDLKETKDVNDDLKLNKKSILNLNELKINTVSNIKKEQQNNLINSSMLSNSEEPYKLFKYDFNQDYLTDAYKLFNSYINDSSMFTMKLKKGDFKTINVPKTVINLFDSLKNILYNKEINIQNYFNTYDYYKILCNNLNDALSFPYYILLYVIYQIIIPHLYVNYNMQEFENILN